MTPGARLKGQIGGTEPVLLSGLPPRALLMGPGQTGVTALPGQAEAKESGDTSAILGVVNEVAYGTSWTATPSGRCFAFYTEDPISSIQARKNRSLITNEPSSRSIMSRSRSAWAARWELEADRR